MALAQSERWDIGWDEFQAIQKTLADNVQGWERRGAVKRGAALLAGLLRCRRCGRKLTVHYTGTQHGFLRYACVRGRLDQGEPKCISFGGIPVDEAIGREILRVVQPQAMEAAVLASQTLAHQQDDVKEALRRDLGAARNEAQRAQKQFDAVDPENRLVYRGRNRAAASPLCSSDWPSTGWAIKETLMDFFGYARESAAVDFFIDWHSWAIRSRLKPIVRLARNNMWGKS